MTNNKQQTAVQWFLDQLIEHRIIVVDKTTYQVKYKHEILLEQAKEIEKEQIEEAFANGVDDEYEWHINNVPRKNSETYYNETYK
jgi:hypothetical protein